MRRSTGRACVLLLSLVVGTTGGSLVTPALGQDPSPRVGDEPTALGYPSDGELGEHATFTVVDEPVEGGTSPGPDDVLTSLTTAADALTPAAWDPVALAATFDAPEQAFASVRDSIGLDPYRGVLRGAAGTLAARSGSAADRALLLATLLGEMGLTTRFAFADLDKATAQAVLDRSMAGPSVPLQGPPDTDPELLRRIATRASRDHALLRSALGDATGQLGTVAEPDASERLGTHTWVQLEQDGQWLDLDPTMPDAQPGDVVSPAMTTGEAIPADERASLTIRVVAENLIDGVIQPMIALERKLDVADVSRAPVLLLFQPAGGGGLLGGTGLPTAYEPVLWAGGGSSVGTAIPVLSTDDPFFGSGSDTRLTRLAVELETTSPGRDPASAERILLDRVTSELRDAGAWTVDDLGPMPVVDDLPAVMLAIHQLVVSTGGTDPIKALESSIGAVFIAAELAKAEETGGQPPDDLPLSTMLLPMTSFGTQLALTSERAIVPRLDASVPSRTFIGRPRLYLVSLGPLPDTPEGLQVTTDLAVDGVDVAFASGSEPLPVAALQRVWYGAAQTALETELILRVSQALLEAGRTLDGVSLRMRDPLTVVSDVSAAGGASATLGRDVEDGAIAIVPGDVASARLWWTVDRSDGTTRSILDPGIRAGFVGGLPGGFPLHWGADWDPATNNWVRWYDKTVVRRRCGGGNESLEVTECVVAPTTRQLGLMYVQLMKSYARYLVMVP